MTKLYEGYVEIRADTKRGMIWVNDKYGICRIRICDIDRLGDRIKAGKENWMIDVRST